VTRIWNDPTDFADELAAGFVRANARYVRAVRGGVVRADPTPPGQVAVVVGGGSGHYPAFAGLVGRGLAHGAAMGNLFASPSSRQVVDVATAAQSGGGVLLSYGNYAGDVLNFDAGQERLRAAGIRCETVVVTDDVSSAPKDERQKRRGIAGDLTVFRIAAAASERGADLDAVVAAATRTNERTRSFGVAFSGCTLPGADEPLFTVPEGRMAVGLGIHGEPGIGETDVPTADGLAELLVGRLLDEVPDGVEVAGAHVVPILNGLGSLKYEELFVVYRRIAALLDEAGVVIVDPHVGEYCTSFDMAGCSLTLFWLDDELESLWETPVDTPAYRRGALAPAAAAAAVALPEATEDGLEAGPAESDAASRQVAGTALGALRAAATAIDAEAEELGRLDAVAGDGDHGIGMQRGVHAAVAAADESADRGAGASSVLVAAGDAWADRAGGTSGALWGAMLVAIGEALSDIGAPSADEIVAAVRAGADAITTQGGAHPGDKTMVDALLPFVDTLGSAVTAGSGIADAWHAAADAATAAADTTADMLPRLGRARPHAEKSLGTPDPGAVSFAVVMTAVAATLDTTTEGK
jgi:D-erythrulose 4-kinase